MKTYAFPLQLAREAVFLNRYSDAVKLLKPLSATSNYDAQFLHSYLHFWDDDLRPQAAVAQMRNAAEHGHVEANYLLAVCPDLNPGYIFSLPTTEAGLSHLRFAAEQGSIHAQTDLAQCYLEGIGVQRDVKRARELLEHAYYQQIDARHLVSKTNLLFARLFLDGIGGEQAIDDGLSALWHCRFSYGDPFAAEAISLLIQITEEDTYSITTEAMRNGLPELRDELDKIRARHSTEWQRYLEHYCMTSLHYDLRGASFNDFMSFVFDHFPQSREKPRRPDWKLEAKVDFDPHTLLGYYTRLFTDPAFLLEHWTREAIEQGLGMDGLRGWVDWSLGCALVHADNTIDEAETCIRSIYHLFDKLFAQGGLWNVAYMWWDIGYGKCDSFDIPKREVAEQDHGRLYQASFETMTRVLKINSRACQSAAIHGLGHSSHPEKENVLRQYLADHPDLSDGDRAYVMSAIAGKVL